MIVVCLCPTSLSMIISRSIHLAENGIISFFFMAKSPVSVCVCEHHIFIHSSVDIQVASVSWLLSQHCFEHWGACICKLRVPVFSGYVPKMGLLDHMVLLFLGFFFKEPPYGSSQQQHQFTFPLTVWKGSFYSTPSPAFIICGLFDDGHSDQCEVLHHCSLDLHFSVSSAEHLLIINL